MSELSSSTRARLDAMWQHLFGQVMELIRSEVPRQFGQAWRGGKFQWAYFLKGHGYELMQPGVYTFTTTDIPANADTSNVVTVDYPIGYDTAGAAPAVFATSQDSDWIASATPNGSNPRTQLDLFVSRRQSLQTPEWDTASGTILSGDTYVDVPVTFTPAFQSTPVAVASVDIPLCRVALHAVSTTGATFRVTYVPEVAAGDVSNETTGLTVTDMAPISPATAVKATASTDTGSTDSTGNSSLSNTGNNSDGDKTDSENRSHTHVAPAGGGTTDDANLTHTHKHNAGDGMHNHPVTHTHPVGDHTHPVDNHHHDVDDPGHSHTFTGSPEVAPSNTAFVLHWMAMGLRTSPATTVDVSWLAVGLQALPS